MPLYTYNHCLLCFEEVVSKQPETPESARTKRKNAEYCKRFCMLASRYLNLDPYHFHHESTIKTKITVCSERVCDTCVILVESFCGIYDQLNYLQEQLSWRAHEIARVMDRADKEQGDHTKRKVLSDKLKEIDPPGFDTMAEIDDFRQDFIKSIAAKRAKSDPMLILDRNEGKKKDKEQEDGHESDTDSIFFPPIQVKVSSKKPATNRKSPQGENNLASQTSSGCVSNSSSDKSGKRKKGRGRPPKVTPSSQTSSVLDTPMPSEAESEKTESSESDLQITVKRIKPNTNPAETDSVIILSPEISGKRGSDIDGTSDTSNSSSSRSGIDEVVMDGSNNQWRLGKDEELINPLDTLPVEDEDAEASREINLSRYYKQFQHLKYTCPMLGCNLTFNTMTRMVLHRKATGHNRNAIIDIILK